MRIMRNDPLPPLSHALVTLGLTRDEARVYALLCSRGSQTALDLSKSCSILPNAVYRLIQGLAKKGFVVSLPTRPAKFQAIPAQIAVEAYATAKMQTVERAKSEAVAASTAPEHDIPHTRIDIVTGRQAMFDTFVKLAKSARKEILVISIGEPVPDEVKITNYDAVSRGVSVKLMFHRYTKDNEQLLKSWVRMGAQVRYYPDWGYHMTIIDRKQSILTANNPEETEERISMVIHSESLSKALGDYFNAKWSTALSIST